MYADKLIEVAKTIGDLEATVIAANDQIRVAKEAIAEREFQLTPATGWPGSNADQREIAKRSALAADEALCDLRKCLAALLSALAETNMLLAKSEALRRGLEYAVKDVSAEASITTNDMLFFLTNNKALRPASGESKGDTPTPPREREGLILKELGVTVTAGGTSAAYAAPAIQPPLPGFTTSLPADDGSPF